MVINNTHPFAGFGPAPYRIVGMSEKVRVIPGVSVRAGGTCDHCGTGIRYAYTVRCSDGVEFVVGCDCAEKAGMTRSEIREARRSWRLARLAYEWQAKAKARDDEQRERNFIESGYHLTDSEIAQAARQGQSAARAWIRAERKYQARHVGQIGKRIRGLRLLVERSHSFDTLYGLKTIWILRDERNNQIVLKTTAALGLDNQPVSRRDNSNERYSRWFLCDATVKEHSEYDGMRQTVIQRVKVTAIVSDWIARD